MSKNLATFMSGRLLTLAIVLAFQIMLVRLLSPREYALYAVVFAVAALMQTSVSFGIQRVIAKYFTKVGWTLSFATVRRLAYRLIIFRAAASAGLMALTYGGARLVGLVPALDAWLVLISAAFIWVLLVQMDADAMAQALALQPLSRACSVGEAAARLLFVGALALSGGPLTAAQVIGVAALTFGSAAVVLLTFVLRGLSSSAEAGDERPLDWSELRKTGLSGYAASLAWFTSSPAVIRLIAGARLPLGTFAGFAFAQTLVTSFQRYTPGSLLLPFVEPVAMRDLDRTGDLGRFEAVLSLLSKIDIALIGAAIVGTGVAGEALVTLMTGGKYADQAFALPWLLAYIMATSIYRSFEIGAVALGATSALVRTLSVSLVWLGIAVLLTERFGLVALLVCPVCDALCRIGALYRDLARRGVRHVVDLAVVGTALGLMISVTVLGRVVNYELAPGMIGRIAIGTFAGVTYMALLATIRPMRATELELVARQSPGRAATALASLARP